MKYYFCTITEINGEYEYTSKFLIQKEEDLIDEKLQDVFLNFRSSGDLEGEGFVWFEDGLAAKDPEYQEIPKDHFDVLSQYLAVY